MTQVLTASKKYLLHLGDRSMCETLRLWAWYEVKWLVLEGHRPLAVHHSSPAWMHFSMEVHDVHCTKHPHDAQFAHPCLFVSSFGRFLSHSFTCSCIMQPVGCSMGDTTKTSFLNCWIFVLFCQQCTLPWMKGSALSYENSLSGQMMPPQHSKSSVQLHQQIISAKKTQWKHYPQNLKIPSKM